MGTKITYLGKEEVLEEIKQVVDSGDPMYNDEKDGATLKK